MIIILVIVSVRGGSLGIATRYGLHDPEIEPLWCNEAGRGLVGHQLANGVGQSSQTLFSDE